MPVKYGRLYPSPRTLFHPWEHGNDLVHLTVSLGESSKTFTLHRDLLSRSSPHLQSLLCNQNCIACDAIPLDNLCPTAFEVIYQWLYTGRVFDEIFYIGGSDRNPGQGELESDVFWLRAFKIARVLQLRDLREKIQ